jgi:hypothetical protein
MTLIDETHTKPKINERRLVPIHENLKQWLIVEDDADDRYLMQNALEHIGVTDTVHTVNDGQEAVEKRKGAIRRPA